MKIWRLEWFCPIEKETLYCWYSTREAVEQALKEQTRILPRGTHIDFDQLDIPTTKLGLVRWLNKHLTSAVAEANNRAHPTAEQRPAAYALRVSSDRGGHKN